MKSFLSLVGLSCMIWTVVSYAGVEGSISGTVLDPQGIALSNSGRSSCSRATEKSSKAIRTSATGEFQIFPLQFGD